MISAISKRKNQDYLFLFLLGDSSRIKDSDLDGFRSNGISHLFSISGMHFSLLIGIISYFILRKKNSPGALILLNLFLFGYLHLIDYVPSACRAFLFWELKTISKYLKLNWSDLRCFLWMILLILFWKPFYLFDVGFQFSAVLCFFLCEGKNLFKNQQPFLQSLSFSVFTFMVSLPMVLYYYFSVNFLSIVWNLFLVPFVTTIFFPVQLFSFFLPPLSFLGHFLGEWFEAVSRFLQNFDFLTFTFHKPPIIWIFLYYFCLFLFLKKIHPKKMIGGLVVLIIVLYHWNFFIPQSYFLMIDVGQGDSLLIHSNNHTVLVDTGGNYYQEQGTIYQQKLKPLLASLGIRKLDVLCLTHGDYDHLGEAFPLIQEIPVKKVYFNEGSMTEEEEKLKVQLVEKKISYDILQEGASFRIGKFSFFSLNKV
ncbi:MAG: ComEC/Rec2 family competence protein, partial [Bacilli bacterium]|nr:ComEC/Rec2 family competence protein [Bacilli bacterium]